MDHVAFMRKSWGLIPKIIDGRKIIESRWYKSKYPPYNRIKQGDRIFFKNSGEPVTVKAEVSKVLQFDNLTPVKVRQLLNKYGSQDGIDNIEIPKYYNLFKDKNYCMLIYITNVCKVEPFQISKKGFGNMASWIVVDDIIKITI